MRAKKHLILPLAGWSIFLTLAFFSADQDFNMRVLFWSMGLLVLGTAYALKELTGLRRQGSELEQQLTLRHEELKTALTEVHEVGVERDMVEDALNESQQRYYHLSEATFEALCIHDNGTILDGNQNLAALFHCTLDQLIGSSFLELYAPEFRMAAGEDAKLCNTSAWEAAGLRRNGDTFPMEVATKIIPYNNRQVRVAALRDMTESKRLAQESEKVRRQALLSESRRRAVLDSSIDSILIFDQDDRIVDANQAAEEAFGWTRSQFIGKNVAETVICAAQRPTYQKLFESLKQGGPGFVDKRLKVRALRKDGREFESEVATSSIQNEGGRDFIASVRDISERMEQQRKVQAGLVRMQSLIQSPLAGVLVLDEDQKIIMSNKFLCDLVNKSMDPESLKNADCGPILGMLEDVFLDAAGFGAEVTSIMAQRKKVAPKEYRCSDGRYFERAYIPAESEGQFQGHLWIFRDISEHKKIQVELEKNVHIATDSARFKSQFLANMSHEIRTPMNAIVGMTDLLLDTPLSDEQKDFAQTVRQASDSLLNLINQILDYSKIEAGKLALESEDFDLREELEGVVAMFAAKAHSKGVELALDIADDFNTGLTGDAGRLGQVLVNLVGNAIKFTAEGDVVISARCEVQDDKTAALLVEVKDSGIGIAPEAMAQLFKPFVQADGSITRRFGGTGLGLAISKELVELMGGEIGVESSAVQPRGTRFWIRLCLDKQVNSGTGAGGAEPSKAVLAGLKVLLVDDSSTNRRILAHQLSAWGVSFGEAQSAAEAAGMLENDQPDASGKTYNLVLLDMQMPEKDGLTFACEIKELFSDRHLRVILMSSLGHSPDREILEQAGVEFCLSKPIKRQALLGALENRREGRVSHAQAGQAAHGTNPAHKAKAVAALRVLVAEDNSVNQRVVRSQLEKLGVQVDVVGNGAEALAAVAKANYSLLLMDCQMPVLDGMGATQELRRREAASGLGRRLPVVAMTANALDGDQRRCLEAGMDDYMSKPVKLANLARVLQRWASAEPGEELPVFSMRELSNGLGEGFEGSGLLEELCSLFASDSPKRVARMKSAWDAGDRDLLRKESHALKGSSQSLGLLRLAQVCQALEKQDGNLAASMERLGFEFKSALEALQKAVGKPTLADA